MATDTTTDGDPTDVHPEYDHPEPGNIEEWSEEQIAEYKRRKQADLERESEERQAELSREQQETLSKLRSAVDDDATPTEQIEVGDLELTVRAETDGEIERQIDRVIDLQDGGKLSDGADAMIGVITALVVADAEPDDDSVHATDEAVWWAYYEEHGIRGLAEAFEQVTRPALDKMDDLRFRGENGRGSDGRHAR